MTIYILILNIITFFLYENDKARAKNNEWRIPESILLSLPLAGGCFGALLGIRLFHHKTKKPIFKLTVMFSIIIWSYVYLKSLFKT